MTGRIVFLLEEPSMKALLEGLLPRIVNGWRVGENFLCIQHQGKSDLVKSIPRKLRGWQEPTDRFVIVHDQDSSDCLKLKESLQRLCAEAGRPNALVRIVCHELEAWYLGDLDALADEFGKESFRHKKFRKQFRDPDSISSPSRLLEDQIGDFQKISGAIRMGIRMVPERNTSRSFTNFVRGVERLVAEMNEPD